MLLVSTACALNDLNISVDGGGYILCAAFDGLDTYTCDNTSVSIDGTKDHMMYFIPQPYEYFDISNLTQTTDYLLRPTSFLLGGVALISIIIISWLFLHFGMELLR